MKVRRVELLRSVSFSHAHAFEWVLSYLYNDNKINSLKPIRNSIEIIGPRYLEQSS